MTRIESLLQELGLTEKESVLYLAGLKLGSQTSSVYADRTGLARSTVNFLFQSLIQKGFAKSEKRKNVLFYSVIDPKAIENIVINKVAKSRKLAEDFSLMEPYLESLQTPFTSPVSVETYSGLEGLCRLVDLSCSEDKPGLFMSGNSHMHPELMDYILTVFLPKAREHEHKNRMIITDTPTARDYVKKAKGSYDEIIFVDPKKLNLKLTTFVVGDTVAICSYDPADLTGVVIKNKFIADHMREVINALMNLKSD